MNRTVIFLTGFLFITYGCRQQSDKRINNGTAWAPGSFKSNAERIYFTSTSDRGTPITYTGGPSMGMMMMGGTLACVSCHGTDGRGGEHMMHMEIMNAPDIRWSELTGSHHEEEEAESGHHEEYNFEAFKNSVENGKHPDGDELSTDMPRWGMSDADLKDLMEYLKSL